MNNTVDLSWNQVLKLDFLSVFVRLFSFDTMMSQIEKVRLSEKLQASLKTGFSHLLGSSLALGSLFKNRSLSHSPVVITGMMYVIIITSLFCVLT